MENETNVDVLSDSVNDWLDIELEGLAEAGEQAPRDGVAGGGSPLPCLYIHNVTRQCENLSQKQAQISDKWRGNQGLAKADRGRLCGSITGREKKAGNMLFLNAANLLQRGVERCAFVTITTPENMSYWEKKGWEKARALFRSWIGHKTGLPYVFGFGRDWCRVIEPQRRGAIHWHMLIDLGEGVDIRTGVDFQAFKNRDYRTASPALRSIWARMRESGKAYKLGRVEIMPVRDPKWEACARYVGKYLSKAVQREVWENACDQKVRPLHARRVGFSKGGRVATIHYSWLNEGREWRRGVELLAIACGAENYGDLKEILGPKWAWNNRDVIENPSDYDRKDQENPL